ncbi:hypothetical protein [Streptomyces bambusae]|uniref:Uncharacterized protein n=1 Tax=Streptomyces bambusae TaxID=1550616 RepID=A0ABS6Z4Z3_9ACTN|nr:hypothetical protein [Streptomyces bambusae]MBW5482848.1 hypothetical protein [Streptomyces bambusae]
MRSSARIPGILAGLALAAGGVVLAAPAAHADMEACAQYVSQHGGQQSAQTMDVVRQACYQGQIGNQTSCTASLDEAAVSKDVAAQACRAAAP